MRVERRRQGESALFVVTDISAQERGAAHALGWVDVDGGAAAVMPADSRYLERAYVNFERHAPQLIARVLGQVEFRWEDALDAVLHLIEEAANPWFLTGSVTLAVRGIPVVPGDIDLVTTEAGARELENILAPDVMQTLTPSPHWVARWFCRAYIHGQVEWVGDVQHSADVPLPSDFGPHAMSHLETVEWRGFQVQVPPVDLALAVNQRRRRIERVRAIEQWIRHGNSSASDAAL